MEKYKTLLTEMEGLKYRDIMVMDQKTLLGKNIYKFNDIPINVPMDFL